MYVRSGRFTTIPTDANLGNLNLFPFKVSSLFHAKPLFVCFSFWSFGFWIFLFGCRLGVLILDGFGIRSLDLGF